MSAEERGRTGYLDLLIATLMEHEKKVDSLVGRLKEIAEELSAIVNGKAAESDSETLVYMKIRVDRPIDEILKIIKSLKE